MFSCEDHWGSSFAALGSLPLRRSNLVSTLNGHAEVGSTAFGTSLVVSLQGHGAPQITTSLYAFAMLPPPHPTPSMCWHDVVQTEAPSSSSLAGTLYVASLSLRLCLPFIGRT